MTLIDLQATPDTRQVELDQVGIRDLSYPIAVLDHKNERQQTIGCFRISVHLPEHSKGTHMSRFVEILHSHRQAITLRTLPILLQDLRQSLQAQRAQVEVRFPYFLERTAPASGQSAMLDYDCIFFAESDGVELGLSMKVTVPVTTLCPCSKAISDYGAHNQRGYLSIEVKPIRPIWIEELVEVAETSASAPVYPLLKRVDERQVTMQAYDNPVFVEDIVRNVAVKLRLDERVAAFTVECVNHESIHNHSAYARTSWERPGPTGGAFSKRPG